MADYIDPEVITTPEELFTQTIEYLQGVMPGWEPADGNLEVWLAEAFSQIAAQIAETAVEVPTAIFRMFGRSILGIDPIDPTAATVATTWTVLDSTGYSIPEGTTISLGTGDQAQAFVTLAEATVAPGQTTVSGVMVEAMTAGATGTGLSGEAYLIDPLDFVVDVQAQGSSTGGADGETDDAYLNRLAEELRLLAPRPILPEDFAVLARRVGGVDRALALDGYDPTDETFDNERFVTVALVGHDGLPVPTGAANAVKALLEAMREVNFKCPVIDPTYTSISVTFAGTCYPGFDPEAIEDAVIFALQEYLSARNWGNPPFGETRDWHNENVVRYLEVAQVINSVEGFRYLTSLSVNGGSGNVNLTGAAPMPEVGTITGSVEHA